MRYAAHRASRCISVPSSSARRCRAVSAGSPGEPSNSRRTILSADGSLPEVPHRVGPPITLQNVQSMFTGLYAQLTGSPGSDLDREHHAMTMSRRWRWRCLRSQRSEHSTRRGTRSPTAVRVGTGTPRARWRPRFRTSVLTRDGEADTHLWEVLARHLDVPAAAVVLRAPAAVFSWWNIQPGDPPQHGHGRGAAELIHRLMPATLALGERPGILRICSERASLSRPP